MVCFSVTAVLVLSCVVVTSSSSVATTNLCVPNPCNRGKCVSRGNIYICVCPDNCRGTHCETCESEDRSLACGGPSPCKRDCVCHESCQHAGGYYCRSASGFLGKNCTVPIPTLRCEPDRMVLSVSGSFVREYDLGMRNSYISVSAALGSSPSCQVTAAVNGHYEVAIPLPFTKCGTVMSTNGKQTVFTNQMWFNRRLNSAMFDMPIPAAEFQCSYTREYKIVTSLKPVISSPTLITARTRIFPTISLCKVSSCPAACPDKFRVRGGAVYTVGEMIHVTMTLDSGSQVTAVRNMFLSCDSSPSTSNIVGIVAAGCGTTSGLPCEVRSNALSHVVCVSFQTPRALGCSEFYIHAELESCDAARTGVCPTPVATKRCSGSRRRRSVDVPPMTVGPILLINGSVGSGTVKIHGMEDGIAVLSIDRKKEAARVDIIAQKYLPPPKPSRSPATVDPTVLIAVFSSLLVLAIICTTFWCLRRRSVNGKLMS